MDAPQRLRGALLVLLAASLWGTLGVFYTWGTKDFGLTPVAVVFWRAGLTAIVMGLALGGAMPALGKGWGLLKVRSGDLVLFALFGLLGITAFYILYIYAVLLAGAAVASVLLYTAPAWVALMAWRWLGEKFSSRKTVALIMTFTGCALVVRVYNPALMQVNAAGILCGLGSALAYALYSILGKVTLRRGYATTTLTFYVYLMGAAGLFVVALFQGPARILSMGADPAVWGFLLVLALVQTIGAHSAYITGLRSLDAGVASILATFEPVVAAVLAIIVLHERLEWPQVVGGVLILGAVLMLQGSTLFKERARRAPQVSDLPNEL